MQVNLLRTTTFALLTMGAGVVGAQDGWTTLAVPGPWEEVDSHANHDGFAWYRAFVSVPPHWRGKRLLLTVEEIDDVDEIFFNGEKTGANGGMPPLFGKPSSRIRRPAVIDTELVMPGARNLVAIRVYDHEERGGITKGPVQLTAGDESLDLSGVWEFRKGDSPVYADWPGGNPDSDAAKEAVAAFLKRTGEKSAGHRGIGPVDREARKRLLASIREQFQGNPNVHSNLDGKGDAKSPDEAFRALKSADDLAIDSVLSEPEVRQPLHMNFDERGRMWVTQYIQYPEPAGLEIVSWDQHMRAVFDAVPPPPPFDQPDKEKFRGLDRITIHEDTDRDGVFDTHKTFVDGLNIATSTLRGRGGVWVMHPPYLLFYPDTNNDDVPDANPVVHLSGFGLEDTHSVANSITWGPDGWIYGATGSTVTARVRAELSGNRQPLAFFGQTIWRYHPGHYLFELFAEGGWNTFGVDFDDTGRVYSGTNGHMQAVRFVQGGYYRKSFGKHGPFNNPHTFGHYNGLPYEGDKRRMVHQWMVYGDDLLPERYQNSLIGVNPLANLVIALTREKNGSSFTTREFSQPVTTSDKWFRPVHCALGPDGAVYVADFYDGRITHLDPRDNWDRERGRIYRLRPETGWKPRAVDLSAFSDAKLADTLRHRNRWFRHTALRLLADRRATSTAPVLRRQLAAPDHPAALESLWALFQLGEVSDDVWVFSLLHSNPAVRRWAVRLAGDRAGAPVADEVLHAMHRLAREDTDPEVVMQLGATLRRIPTAQAMPLLVDLTSREGFSGDPNIPLLCWWAWEHHFTGASDAVFSALEDNRLWKASLFEFVLPRLAQRMAAEATPERLDQATRLLEAAGDRHAVKPVLTGIQTGLTGNSLAHVPVGFRTAISKAWIGAGRDSGFLGLAMRLGDESVIREAMTLVRDKSRSSGERTKVLHQLAATPADDETTAFFLSVLGDKQESVCLAALQALQSRRTDLVNRSVLRNWKQWKGRRQRAGGQWLAGHSDSARELLEAVDSGDIPRESVASGTLFAIERLRDDECSALLKKLWGSLRKPDTAKKATLARVRKSIESGKGDPAVGAEIFNARCAICHRLFDEGGTIGPELTGYERDNLEFLLTAIVDPNLAVREEFELATVTARSAEPKGPPFVVTGFVTDSNERLITVRDLAGQEHTIPKNRVLREERSKTSAMPEGLIDDLNDKQLRDFFAYLGREKK